MQEDRSQQVRGARDRDTARPGAPGRTGRVTPLFHPRGRSQSAVETVIEAIKTLLIERRLHPGDLLPSENEIAGSLSISRGSIREAMKILSAFGVVEIRQGDGTYVATSANKKLFDPLLFNLLVTQPELEELAELRILVEEGIIKLIIRHADESDLEQLERAYEAMAASMERDPPDPQELFATDLSFHRTLGAITRNRLVTNVYQFVIDLLAPTMRPGHGLETHRRLVETLRSRDLEGALRAVAEHDEIWQRLNVPPAGREQR